MPPAARLGDICTGHECFPPRANIEGSPTVYVNGIPLHRQGDGWSVHCCTHPEVPHGCHGSVLASGSPTVYANGRQAGRIGDPVACGGNVAAVRSAPSLKRIIENLNLKKNLPKYKYPPEVLTAFKINYLSEHGVDFRLSRNDLHWISRLDNQRKFKKAIFGSVIK